MGNLVSLLAHLPRGHETIAGVPRHMVMDEAGGHAVVVGRTIRALRERADGTHGPGRDRGRVPRPRRRPRADHGPRRPREHPRATRAAGRCRWTTRARVAAIAHERGVPLHVDGARLSQRGRRPGHAGRASWPRPPTPSRSACRRASPPRSAPSSSAAATFIARARRARKLLGGGMRQVGVLAAAGLVALRDGADGHDRPPRRGPRQRAPPRRGPGGARRHPLARRHRPAGRGRPARPGPRPDQLRPVPRGPRPVRVPRRPRGARRRDGPLRPRPDPRRHPPRGHRRRRRPGDRRRRRRPARDGPSPAAIRPPARPDRDRSTAPARAPPHAAAPEER